MSAFACKACGRAESKWFPQCPGCERWSTIERTADVGDMFRNPLRSYESIPNVGLRISHAEADDIDRDEQVRGHIPERDPEPATFVPAIASPVRITDVQDEDLERTLTNLAGLDRVLGGGLVTASVVLIGGDPGGGKSTLVAQAIANVGQRVLYVTGEETIEQATMRARRVGATHPEIWIVASHDVDETIAAARALAPAILTVDSIQTLACSEIGGVAGSLSQIRECTLRLARYAKQCGVTVIIVGHVTKDGALAGPNTLKHLVDVVLVLECAELGNRRTLRSDKNRFGSTGEIGVFEMSADGMIAIEPDEAMATDSDPCSEAGHSLGGGCEKCVPGYYDSPGDGT